jgi:cyanate permease
VLAVKQLELESLLPGQFPRLLLVEQELAEAVKALELLLVLKPELALLVPALLVLELLAFFLLALAVFLLQQEQVQQEQVQQEQVQQEQVLPAAKAQELLLFQALEFSLLLCLLLFLTQLARKWVPP